MIKWYIWTRIMSGTFPDSTFGHAFLFSSLWRVNPTHTSGVYSHIFMWHLLTWCSQLSSQSFPETGSGSLQMCFQRFPSLASKWCSIMISECLFTLDNLLLALHHAMHCLRYTNTPEIALKVHLRKCIIWSLAAINWCNLGCSQGHATPISVSAHKFVSTIILLLPSSPKNIPGVPQIRLNLQGIIAVCFKTGLWYKFGVCFTIHHQMHLKKSV